MQRKKDVLQCEFLPNEVEMEVEAATFLTHESDLVLCMMGVVADRGIGLMEVLGPEKMPNMGFSTIEVGFSGADGFLALVDWTSNHGLASERSSLENSVDGDGRSSSFFISSIFRCGERINCRGLSGNANGASMVRLPFSFV